VAERRRRAPDPEPLGPNQALDLAARFLATRPRSRWEVQRRLARTAADPVTVERTLTRLEEMGLVDDAAFARWWREQRDRHAPRGRRMLESELRAKGVPRDVIEELRQTEPEWAPEEVGLPTTEEQRANEALDAHLRGRPLPVERRALERIGMYLVRRGFDPGTARALLRERAALAADAGTDATDELSEPAD
jgi:regulatory protein